MSLPVCVEHVPLDLWARKLAWRQAQCQAGGKKLSGPTDKRVTNTQAAFAISVSKRAPDTPRTVRQISHIHRALQRYAVPLSRAIDKCD